MPTQPEVATAHQTRRTLLADRVTSRILREWALFDLNNLDGSWSLRAERMIAQLEAAQAEAARQADRYLVGVAATYKVEPPAPLPAESFAGVTLDGRQVGPAMFGAVTTTKGLIRGGRPPREAFTVGASFLATVVGSAIQDMGRQADMVGAASKKWTRYVRVLNPGACSRCAVLAGKASASVAFLRHPRCHCTAFPIMETKGNAAPPSSIISTPGDYFHSLSRAEQDRIFTTAGAEAIRAGADVSKVVNARRGAYGIGYSGHYYRNVPTSGNLLQPVTIGVKPDGSPLRVFATTEGTTARSSFGRRSTSIRLMPEQIVRMAGNNPDRLVELLRRYGYIY